MQRSLSMVEYLLLNSVVSALVGLCCMAWRGGWLGVILSLVKVGS